MSFNHPQLVRSKNSTKLLRAWLCKSFIALTYLHFSLATGMQSLAICVTAVSPDFLMLQSSRRLCSTVQFKFIFRRYVVPSSTYVCVTFSSLCTSKNAHAHDHTPMGNHRRVIRTLAFGVKIEFCSKALISILILDYVAMKKRCCTRRNYRIGLVRWHAAMPQVKTQVADLA